MKDCCPGEGDQQNQAVSGASQESRRKTGPSSGLSDKGQEVRSEVGRLTPPEADTPTPYAADVGSAHVAGDDCCGAKEQEIAALGTHADVKRVLKIVLAINLVMFVAEFTAGLLARSTALMADSVDMLGDALVYLLSLYALNRGLRWRAGAALLKGGIIAAFGVWVLVEVVLKLTSGTMPTAQTMGIFGFIALVANLICLGLLYRYRNRDVNMSSTFECSRNDVIANTGVIFAAAGVYAFKASWPDIVVGSIIALLFFRSAVRVLRQAWPQFRSGRPQVAVPLD